MQRRWIVLGLALVALVGGWAAFRPERLWTNKTVNETFEAASAPAGAEATAEKSGPTLLGSGRFHNGAHETAGAAAVYQLADGTRVVRLTDFRTSNGPDVRVYLVAAGDAMDNDTVKKAGFVDLGALKGNVGDQNYDVPANVDLSKYRAVTIWCRRFSVNFGTSPLAAAPGTGAVMQQAAAAPRPLSAGAFHSGAHETQGSATLYELADGKRLLRLTAFHTSNGPDVRVYLVAAGDAMDNDTVKKAGFVDLGALKGNVGDQNYEVPANVDLSKYRAVTIWCRRFGVNFGTSPLATQQS